MSASTLDRPLTKAEEDRLGIGIEAAISERVDQQNYESANPVLAAIRAVHPAFFTPQVLAMICAGLACKVASSSWSHMDHAETAVNTLDDLSTDMGAV